MMATPRPPHRRAPVDHVAEVLMHLEACEKALARIDEGKVSTDGRTVLQQLRTAVMDSRLSCAEAMEVLLGGRLVAPKPGPPRPVSPTEEIAEGAQVCIVGVGSDNALHEHGTVDKVTKTLIMVGTRRFRRSTGHSVPRSDGGGSRIATACQRRAKKKITTNRES